MPFMAGKCEGCREYDHLEFVAGVKTKYGQKIKSGAWLCKYCLKTFYEEGEIELVDQSTLALKTFR